MTFKISNSYLASYATWHPCTYLVQQSFFIVYGIISAYTQATSSSYTKSSFVYLLSIIFLGSMFIHQYSNDSFEVL